jgi:hypothetical protein
MGAASSAWQNAPLPAKKQGGTEKDPNQAVIKSIMDKALAEGNVERLEALAPQAKAAGYDPNIWLTAAGLQTPEQQTQQSFDRILSDFTQGLLSGKTTQTQPISPTEPSPDGTTQPPLPADPETRQTRENIYDSDFLLRAALKKFSGIDVGENYLHNESWYNDFGKLREAGVPVSTAVNRLAAEYGFIPTGASNLKDLSKEERQVIFNKEFYNNMANPDIETALAQQFPNSVDRSTNLVDPKVKAGMILFNQARNGAIIPDNFKPFLERFIGLGTPEDIIGPDESQYIYRIFGKHPADASPDEVSAAKKAVDNERIIQAARNAAATETSRTQAQYDMESSKPISAPDRAKYGIGAQTRTYEDLANSGKRFPTEADRKIYTSYSTIKNKMTSMETMLFGQGGWNKPSKNGIFSGIENRWDQRKLAQAGLMEDVYKGNERGQNLQIYNDNLAAFARDLLILSHETGRFTDKDVAQLIRKAPDPGGLFGAPDSQEVAKRKYESFIVDLNRSLIEIEQTTVISPTGQPTPAPPPPSTETGVKFLGYE